MQQLFSLQNKTAVITGAGSGIGRAIAELFAERGAHIFILDLNEENASSTAGVIQQAGGKADIMLCNVTDNIQAKEVIKKVVSQAGRVDILVNSAGVSHVGTIETTTESDFDRIYQVNVKGVFNMMQAVIEPMKAQASGVILNLASIAATAGLPDRFAYSMSKGAVLTMTLSVARDFIRYNIRCNCISPARIHTPFVDGFLKKNYPGKEEEMFDKLSKAQPIGRMGRPDEVAKMALYLCSEEASFVTGCDYLLDGGFMHLNS